MMKKFKKKKEKVKAKVNKKMADRQEDKEAKWREGLMKAEDKPDAGWHTMDSWLAIHTKEHKPKGKLELEAERRAKKALLAKVHSGVTKKIMIILTEITAQVLEGIEGPMRAADDEGGAVINAMSAVAIATHFGLQAPGDKWEYLRRLASDKMSMLLMVIFEDDPSRLLAMKEQISELISAKEADIATMITSKFDGMMEGSDSIAEQLASKTPEGAAVPDMDEMITKTTEMVDSMGQAVTNMALGKAKAMTAMLCTSVVGVIDEMVSAYKKVVDKGAVDGSGNLTEESQLMLQEDTYALVMEQYGAVNTSIGAQVMVLVHFLGMMMKDDSPAAAE